MSLSIKIGTSLAVNDDGGAGDYGHLCPVTAVPAPGLPQDGEYALFKRPMWTSGGAMAGDPDTP